MYYGDDGWCSEGERSKQMTHETKWGIGLINFYRTLPKQNERVELDYKGATDAETIQLTKKTGAITDTYINTGGVCFYSTLCRTNNSYKRLTGKNAVNPAISNSNPDYKAASNQSGKKGYGAAIPFVNKGLATKVTREEVWAGALQIGAALQLWRSDSEYDLSGHSFTFVDYEYNPSGEIIGLYYLDSHGFRKFSQPTGEFIIGANLIDPE